MTKQQPWWNGAVIYQLIVRSFADGNGDGIGDLQGLANRLPYLRWLGVEAIWLTPIYPSPLQDGGYDITDFKSIHPELGDLAAFHRVLIAAHSHGIKVVMDLVLNHTSTLHPWFQRARWAQEGSPERDVYVWSDDPKRYADAPVLFRHFESSNWEWDEVAQQYYFHRFLRHQPDLNYDSPIVQKEMLDVVDFWIERGVDGFRLDAVPFLFETEGSRCEGLPETHEFLKRLRARVDSHGKDVLLLAEAIQPVEEAAPYLADDELHGAFNFALTAHLFASIASGTVEALRECLQAAQNAVGGSRWALPLRNHDELWLGDGHLVSEDVIQTIRAGLHQGQGHWLNWGINRRLAPLLNGDPGSNRVMHALLYSLPGLPCLYYGDELGMGDWPGLRDRDPNRTPMAWTPGRNGGFSTAPDPLLVLPPITAPGYDYRVVNVEVQKQLPGSLLNWHRRMLTCRKLLPALRNGGFELLECAHPGVIVYVRTNATMTVMVAANLSAAGASFRLDLSRWSGERTREVLWGCDFPPADADWFVYLAAHGFSWWLIGEVEEADNSSEDFEGQQDKLSPDPSGALGSPTPASSRRA